MTKQTNHRRGMAHYKATIPDEDVDLMRDLHEDGMTVGEIARKFEANYWTVRDIVQYRVRVG